MRLYVGHPESVNYYVYLNGLLMPNVIEADDTEDWVTDPTGNRTYGVVQLLPVGKDPFPMAVKLLELDNRVRKAGHQTPFDWEVVPEAFRRVMVMRAIEVLNMGAIVEDTRRVTLKTSPLIPEPELSDWAEEAQVPPVASPVAIVPAVEFVRQEPEECLAKIDPMGRFRSSSCVPVFRNSLHG